MSKRLWVALGVLGAMAFLGLFTVSSMRLGHSVETLVGPDGDVVATHMYGLSGWTRAAGAFGLLGCVFLGVAVFAAVAGRPSLTRITLILGLVASLSAWPVTILVALFAMVAMATARERQHLV